MLGSDGRIIADLRSQLLTVGAIHPNEKDLLWNRYLYVMVAAIELTSSAFIDPPGHLAGIPAETQAGLERLVRLRMRKCLVLLPKILGADNANAVHDLRVWSRRSRQLSTRSSLQWMCRPGSRVPREASGHNTVTKRCYS